MSTNLVFLPYKLFQFMKQKLLRNRLTGIEHPLIEIDEDEKKRIVLGTVNSLYGNKSL